MSDPHQSLFGPPAAEPEYTNTRAEQVLLGLLLSRVEWLERVPPEMTADMLCAPLHADIYRALAATRDTQERGPVLIAVGQLLGFSEKERLYLVGLLDTVPGFLPEVLASCVEIIVTLSRKRALAETLSGLQADLAKPDGPPIGALIAKALTQFDVIAADKGKQRPLIDMNAALDAAMEAANRASQSGGVSGLSTGMRKIDRIIGGLQPKTMTVLAGRPGMGKSALAAQWAVNVAVQARDNPSLGGVFIASLEMAAEQIAQRVLAYSANVDASRLRDGRHRDYAYQLELARADLDNLPILIDDDGSSTIAQVRLRTREAARRLGKLSLIVIDHMHIVEPDERDLRRDNMTIALGRISAGCKALAKEFDCAVLALAQLSRKLEDREDKRPVLSDLRQAGNIEQDADTVAFVYRPEYYVSDEPTAQKPGEGAQTYQARVRAHDELKANVAGKAEIIFEKVRGGRKATAHLRFRDETVSFEEPA